MDPAAEGYTYVYAHNTASFRCMQAAAGSQEKPHDRESYVTGHEKIGLMCTQNLTKFLNFKV